MHLRVSAALALCVCLVVWTKSVASAKSTPASVRTTGNVLFIGAVGSKSQKYFYDGLIEAMANNGFNVTILTPYSPARTIPNVREIVIKENDIGPIMPNVFTEGELSPVLNIMQKGPEMCFRALGSPIIADVLKEKYDLAFVSIFFNECFLPHIASKQIPFVFVNPVECFALFNGQRMGNPTLSSFDYNPMLNYKTPLTFFQRLVSAFSEVAMGAAFKYINSRMDSRGRALGLYADDTPHMADLYTNASLFIVNSFRLTEHPRPYMPNILLAGGIHCKPAKPLPKDLEDWVSGSGEAGFIYFSLGSALRPSDVPVETMKILASVFKSLPQRVLWKFNLDALPVEMPANVRLTKWAPQQDLLGHSRVRLFITQGGIFSTQEATYHGVPVLGLPVFVDQTGNMAKAEMEGWGKSLNWKELSYDLVRNTINTLIEDPHFIKEAKRDRDFDFRDTTNILTDARRFQSARHKFIDVMRRNAKKCGELMRDRPISPSEEVAWWAGYLIRTGGAKHLRSGAADLPWWKLYNTDVWLVVVLTGILLLWLLLKTICRCCCARKAKKSTKKSKKN